MSNCEHRASRIKHDPVTHTHTLSCMDCDYVSTRTDQQVAEAGGRNIEGSLSPRQLSNGQFKDMTNGEVFDKCWESIDEFNMSNGVKS